jgi:hypothetical protein
VNKKSIVLENSSAITGNRARIYSGVHMMKKNGEISISEDWLAVIIAFIIILLTSIGVLGKSILAFAF